MSTEQFMELSCVNCDVYIVRDSQEHDEIHINEEDKIFCRDCLDKCNCFCCNEDKKKYCEVGEHYVKEEDMWSDFADCKNCVSEKEYINNRENV